MIYSTNRTTSLGNITVDVNESYFGAGMLDFMQENAQDELALFEAAIKSDIDEVLIGESAYELEALNENFIQSAAQKIKEMMKKFIEWLKSVTRSALAKLTQLLVRDNAEFVKKAKKAIINMKNPDKFKYSGKAIKLDIDMSDLEKTADKEENLYAKAKDAKTEVDLDNIKSDIEKLVEEYNKDENDLRKGFDEECVEEVDLEGKAALDCVNNHIKLLEDLSKKNIQKIKKSMKEMESKANKLAKDAEKAEKNYSGKDELQKKRLAVMAQAAAAYRDICQKLVSDSLYIIKQTSKISRAVVTKAMGATPKNEGFEYSEELIDAMIETANYEYDEALEEMSEAKKSDDYVDDDIDDDEE